MNPGEINLIRQGFERIEPMAEQVGVAVYNRLFAIDPSARSLFRGDIRTHARNLMGALATVVHSLDDLSLVLGNLRALGARHATYGARVHHVTIGGTALVATLEAWLGDSFTAEAREAWTRAYQLVGGVMSEALPSA